MNKILLLAFILLPLSLSWSMTNQQYLNEQLVDAALEGSNEKIEFLLGQGANINAQNEFGETALHRAAFWSKLALAKLLLIKGATIDIKNNDGKTPLFRATDALYKSLVAVEIAELLIKRGADVNTQDNQGYTPLYNSARYNFKPMVKLLLDYAADSKIENSDGLTALWEAHFDSEKKEVIQLLDEYRNLLALKALHNKNLPREIIKQIYNYTKS